jgi:outer membrane protein assembly factor BamB
MAVLILLGAGSGYGADHWGQFRGSHAGVSLEKKTLPVTFGGEKNVLWKTAVPHGHSSPCIWGDRIFLTGVEFNNLETLCIDRKSGKILWKRKAWHEFIERVHQVNTPATPTPATEGKRVYVYFGSSGLSCYDFEGKEVWRRIMPPPPNMYGTASSPILAGGRLIFFNDNQRKSSLEAIDSATGETIWKVDRPRFKASWSTPMVWRNRGVDEVVVYGTWWLKAYALKDGAERWSLPGLTTEPCITPVAGDGLVYLTSYNMKNNPEAIGLPKWEELVEKYDKDKDGELTEKEVLSNKSILSRFDADGEGDHPLWGFHRHLDVDRNGKINEKEWGKMIRFLSGLRHANALMAVKPGVEKGEETQMVWKETKGVPECPSLLLHEGRIYMVKNGGMISCLDAKTGDLKYRSGDGLQGRRQTRSARAERPEGTDHGVSGRRGRDAGNPDGEASLHLRRGGGGGLLRGDRFTIPPLVSGGIMLSYRCTNACRHCLYRCSPRMPDEWMTLETAGRIFHALAGEPRLGTIHLAGGEPTIRMERLLEIIRLAVKAGIPLAYVETNASWCRDRDTAVEGMEKMREAGLPAILVSVSIFHNEFVPFRRTRHAVEAAYEIFGRRRTLIYLPQMFEILSRMEDDGKHSLEEFSRWAGIEERPETIPAMYSVIPSGRACTALRFCYPPMPAASFEGMNCFHDLTSTSHFHIDHHGDLFTGLCAGLAPATIDDLHPAVTAASHPVFHGLAVMGPHALMEMARDQHGYAVREEGYVSKCDLCLDVRACLHTTGAFPELRPESFYEESTS